MVTAIVSVIVVVLLCLLLGVGVRVFMPATVKRVTRDRRPRVRMHLMDAPGVELPSIEGLLASSPTFWRREYVIAIPVLIPTVDGNPVAVDAPFMVIAESRVAFYERSRV